VVHDTKQKYFAPPHRPTLLLNQTYISAVLLIDAVEAEKRLKTIAKQRKNSVELSRELGRVDSGGDEKNMAG
jgi:hypothetical protein